MGCNAEYNAEYNAAHNAGYNAARNAEDETVGNGDTDVCKYDGFMLNRVREIFTRHLEDGQHRKTPERYAILEAIYTRRGHFDVEDLVGYMDSRNYHVSRATLYSTLDLLVECKLVFKHQFGRNLAQFERSYGNKPHDHLICLHCGKIIEVECQDDKTGVLVGEMAATEQFAVSHHTLYIYGLCFECRKNQNA